MVREIPAFRVTEPARSRGTQRSRHALRRAPGTHDTTRPACRPLRARRRGAASFRARLSGTKPSRARSLRRPVRSSQRGAPRRHRAFHSTSRRHSTSPRRSSASGPLAQRRSAATRRPQEPPRDGRTPSEHRAIRREPPAYWEKDASAPRGSLARPLPPPPSAGSLRSRSSAALRSFGGRRARRCGPTIICPARRVYGAPARSLRGGKGVPRGGKAVREAAGKFRGATRGRRNPLRTRCAAKRFGP